MNILARIDWIALRSHLGDEQVNWLIDENILVPVKLCVHGNTDPHWVNLMAARKEGNDPTAIGYRCPGAGVREGTQPLCQCGHPIDHHSRSKGRCLTDCGCAAIGEETP